MFKQIMLTLVIVFSIAPRSYAQDHPNLSGMWKLNLAKSDYGDLQGPNSRTDVIEQHGTEVKEQVTTEKRHKTQSYELVFTTDGKQTTLAPGDGIQMDSVTLQSISSLWQGSSLVVKQRVKYEDANLIAKYIYTLSPDGNTLTMTLSLNGSDTFATFVFDRLACATPCIAP